MGTKTNITDFKEQLFKMYKESPESFRINTTSMIPSYSDTLLSIAKYIANDIKITSIEATDTEGHSYTGIADLCGEKYSFDAGLFDGTPSYEVSAAIDIIAGFLQNRFSVDIWK